MKKLLCAALLALLPAMSAQAGVFKGQVKHISSMTFTFTGDLKIAASTATASTPTITLDGNLSKITTDLLVVTSVTATDLTATTLDLNGADVGSELTSLSISTQSNAANIADIIISSMPPVGSITLYSTDTVPAGWFECDGSTRSRTGESALFAVIGITFGAGDGSTTFHLPDMRGMFARGWDHGAGTDVDAGARVTSSSGTVSGDNIGSFQDDNFESHNHTAGVGLVSLGGSGFLATANVGATGLTGGNETRPKNIYLMYIIKN